MSISRYWVAECNCCGRESTLIDGHGTMREAKVTLNVGGWRFRWKDAFCPKCAKQLLLTPEASK